MSSINENLQIENSKINEQPLNPPFTSEESDWAWESCE